MSDKASMPQAPAPRGGRPTRATAERDGRILARVEIAQMGSRGEGLCTTAEGTRLRVPYAVPGDLVTVDAEADERATLIGLVAPSAERIAPICPYFTTCGGCAVQGWNALPYAAWKRGLLEEALVRAGVKAEVAPLVDAHGAGRRRATFHARTDADGRTRVGFMEARAHAIVQIEHCPVLAPTLDGALPAARAIVKALDVDGAGLRKPLDFLVTATRTGLDIDLRGHGPLDDRLHARLIAAALDQGLARLSNHGTIVVERRKPEVAFGAARVALPPGTFLQATDAGETAVTERIVAALAGAKRVADLFSGIGTFALRIAERAEVFAVDSEGPALDALDRAARATPGLRAVTVATRDLYGRPLSAAELARFDAVVLDPPRAGAEAQTQAIAASSIERVISVSCAAATFARDAALLVAAGFVAESVTPIDQFRYSAHVEIVGVFARQAKRKPRRLFG